MIKEIGGLGPGMNMNEGDKITRLVIALKPIRNNVTGSVKQ